MIRPARGRQILAVTRIVWYPDKLVGRCQMDPLALSKGPAWSVAQAVRLSLFFGSDNPHRLLDDGLEKTPGKRRQNSQPKPPVPQGNDVMSAGRSVQQGCTRAMLIATLAILAGAPTNLAAVDTPAVDTPAAAIEQAYGVAIQPLLRRYCFECHSGDRTEAEIDLADFKNLTAVRNQVKTWLKIREMLDDRQMPPQDSPQPTGAERLSLQTWVRDFLTAEAQARAGDPGPVVLRRLNNAEYNYTVRDLTGIGSLDPTREFPVDGAAGEGFTNTGSAQAMSPSLVTKYLDAAKEVAEHAMLLPDGIRFSPHTTRRDQTDELLARIQQFYREFTEDGGGASVNLQGIKFETNQGGLLPLEKYLAATLEERDSLTNGSQTIEAVAKRRSLNARYLGTLWQTLAIGSAPTSPVADKASILIDGFRLRWQRATAADAPQLAAEIALAQKSLWKFNAVGQLGAEGLQKTWMEAVAPIVSRQDLRFPLPASPVPASPAVASPAASANRGDIVIYLAANDLGDGRDSDFVVWDRPRFEFKADASGQSHPPILLRDVRALVGGIHQTMAAELPRTMLYLEAVAQLRAPTAALDEVAKAGALNDRLLKHWAELMGLGQREKREIRGHFTTKLTRVHGYEAINGWGTDQTPSLLTNRSNEEIAILTFSIPARSVVVHPSPTQESVVAWRSPLDGKVRIEGRVADTDNQCGNGAAWRVELQSAAGTAALANGVFDNGRDQQFHPPGEIDVHRGDVVSLFVNARDSSHACDTTHVDLKLSEVGGDARTWNLASDVVDKILEANPLPDSYGHAETWHFCATGNQPPAKSVLEPGSTLAQWRAAILDAKSADEIRRLAASVQHVVTSTSPASLDEPDRRLREQLLDWKGPLKWTTSAAETAPDSPPGIASSELGIDPARFGKHPSGAPIEPGSLCVQAPQVLEVRLPAALVAGADFVVSGELHGLTGDEGSVQLQVLPAKPEALVLSLSQPILVRPGGAAQRRLEAAMAEFRELFPAALCYARIVPVDEVVTMTLFFREDDHLKRLMLNDQQAAALDRLWDELFYVAQEPIALTVAFEQIYEFATQDRPDLVKAFGPMRKPINDRADLFRARLLKTEPAHVNAILEFASRAWRRPLSDSEQAALRRLYGQLRDADIVHEEAIRLTLARTLTSPSFLYRHEEPAPGQNAAPVSRLELANRLSYFLWSSLPDDELRGLAEGREPVASPAEPNQEIRSNAKDPRPLADEALLQQTRRMLKDARTRRLAIQFACQWMHLRDFDQNDDKNEKLYPEFVSLRGDMYEETVRFFEDMFRNDGSILGLLDADHTFLNATLARHYGIAPLPGSEHSGSDAEWRRVENIQSNGRGGILGMASLLASQSGASRTSPILRGNWVYETLLGERLPRPPANVPQLPETVPTGLTARQLIEQHSSAAACAKCHVLIDPYGFALEQYDAIGRLRKEPADTKTKLVDGTKIEGLGGLRSYLLTKRRDDVVRQFCRKLLGYSLGREVQLSDELLLDEMQRELAAADFRFRVAVETIVLSKQFREIRGREFSENGADR